MRVLHGIAGAMERDGIGIPEQIGRTSREGKLFHPHPAVIGAFMQVWVRQTGVSPDAVAGWRRRR